MFISNVMVLLLLLLLLPLLLSLMLLVLLLLQVLLLPSFVSEEKDDIFDNYTFDFFFNPTYRKFSLCSSVPLLVSF